MSFGDAAELLDTSLVSRLSIFSLASLIELLDDEDVDEPDDDDDDEDEDESTVNFFGLAVLRACLLTAALEEPLLVLLFDGLLWSFFGGLLGLLLLDSLTPELIELPVDTKLAQF
jgi:hypothetical protein